MYNLEPSIKTIWAIRIFTQFTIYAVIIAFLEFTVIPNNLNSWIFPKGIFALAFFVYGFLSALIIPHFKYKYWKFDVRNDEIFVEYGIFTRIRTIAPYKRIQHLDIQQTLLERFAHIGKLVIYTAGTRGADVVIPGLPIEYAEQLRDKLKELIKEDDAV